MPGGVSSGLWLVEKRQGRIFIGLKQPARPFPIPGLSRPFFFFFLVFLLF
jgi:hypothetical protein